MSAHCAAVARGDASPLPLLLIPTKRNFTMLNCPRCQSPNIVSNKLDEAHLTRVMQFAHAAQNFENKRLSALGGLAAFAIKTVDVLRKDYRCYDCEHRFDA